MLRRVFAMAALFVVVMLLAVSTTVTFKLMDVVSDIRLANTAGRTIVFEMEDPTGDDYGPGSYVYPANQLFEPFKGIFDLQKFSVHMML